MSLSAAGTTVGSITGFDTNGDPFVFQLVPSSSQRLFRVAADGAVTVVGPLDFEAAPAHVLSVTIVETSSGRNCPLATTADFVVTVLNQPDPPELVALSAHLAVAEESTYPALAAPASGFMRALDLLPANTSLITVAVTAAVERRLVQVSLLSIEAPTVCFAAVSTLDGAACVGGVACSLQLVRSCPRLDYDAGLRGFTLLVNATGATGLWTSTVVDVTVESVNEGMRVLCIAFASCLDARSRDLFPFACKPQRLGSSTQSWR